MKNEQNKSSGERLEALLDHFKLTQVALSQKIGVSTGYISQMVKNHSPITSRVASELIKIFPSINSNWLLSGRGSMFLDSPGNSAGSVNEPGAPYVKSMKIVPKFHGGDTAIRAQVGENIRHLAQKWGMGKGELFEMLMPGVQKQSVTNYLKGTSQPPLWVLLNLEHCTGIPLGEWMSREIQGHEFPEWPLSDSPSDRLSRARALFRKIGIALDG